MTLSSRCQHPVFNEEWIERYGVILLVCEIDAVLTVRPRVDKVAKSLIGIAGIHKQHMGSLLEILSYHVVGEE